MKFIQYKKENYLEVIGKKFPIARKVKDVHSNLILIFDKYRDRAKLAKDNDGVDWKAVSHAFRCMYEVESLLEAGEIVFPLPNREFLENVKLGKIPWL